LTGNTELCRGSVECCDQILRVFPALAGFSRNNSGQTDHRTRKEVAGHFNVNFAAQGRDVSFQGGGDRDRVLNRRYRRRLRITRQRDQDVFNSHETLVFKFQANIAPASEFDSAQCPKKLQAIRSPRRPGRAARRRDCNPQRLGAFEVDAQNVLIGLLHRKIARMSALQNFVDQAYWIGVMETFSATGGLAEGVIHHIISKGNAPDGGLRFS
jgi:hypothetical protein